MATQSNDIKKTGPQSYRDLQRQNSRDYMTVSGNPYLNIKPSYQYATSTAGIYEGPEMSPIQLNSDYDYWGKSQYDNPSANEEEFEAGNLNDTRYGNQPWYDTLANGVGKMLGTAGTTFVSSLVGLPYGIGTAIAEGRWSGLWDNDVTKGLADVDKWLEDNMTNYKSQKQQEAAWYDPENLFSMNFIADDVIKNMGFTLGAAASMAVGSGTLGLMSKSLGFVNEVSSAGKMANNTLAALFSATGEGMIEARQGVEERNKLELQRLNDALAPEEEALKLAYRQANEEYARNMNKQFVRTGDGKIVDPAYEVYRARILELNKQRDALAQKRTVGEQQIEESGREMGNKILLANQALLTAGNLIQFSKGMTKSFDRARHAAESSSKYAAPFGLSAERAGKTLKEGYEITGSKKLGKIVAGIKGLVTEGSEEMNQQMIQSTSGAAYNEKDVNDYWRAKLDPEAYRETTKGLYTFGNIISQGFRESWGDLNQWEQFAIGALTGMTGTYMPSKLFNQDKSKSVLNPARYGSWEGGAYNDVRDYNREVRQYEENISDLNRILASEDFPARLGSMVGRTFMETQKDEYVDENDKKSWKDADDKQSIMDIQAFLRAGKLDDLRAIYAQMGKNMTDEDIENIVKSTTREVGAEEDKKSYDLAADEAIAQKTQELNGIYDELEAVQEEAENSGNLDAYKEIVANLAKQIDSREKEIADLRKQKQDYVGQKYYVGAYVDLHGNRTATNDEIREEVQHNSDALTKKLNSYLDSIDYINRRTNGQLTKDQEDNLAYLHNLGKQSLDRMQKIMAGVRKQLPTTFLLKTDKTPEQLAKEYASSDLTFNKDENTKEGYIEVDTSLMNDAAFADFFQKEVMRGGNIRPEFAETADERKAREAEEESLSEEEKKAKTKERASKKWRDALQQWQDDANEQWDTNWQLLVDNFIDNFRKDGTATLDESIEAFGRIRQDLQDASDLFNQAGEYFATLDTYMKNPSLVDRDKAAEEKKANKAEAEHQAKNKFAGKSSQQLKQELADGTLDIDEFEDFAGADLSDVTDDDVLAAQSEAKKVQEGRQTAASLKHHIQEQLGDNPTPEELTASQMAMQMIDDAYLNIDDPSELGIDTPELSQVPIEMVDPNASIEDIDKLNQDVQSILADAFNAVKEDQDAQDDIPDELPSTDGVEAPETGADPAPTVVASTATPDVKTPSEATQVVPVNPLDAGAIDNIIAATENLYEKPSTNGTWRSTTTRNVYRRSTGTYHEDIAKPRFGENSKEYKRSKAIWEYLNSIGAFERQSNSSKDRIKAGDTIHFMVKNFAQEMYGKDFGECTDEEKLYSLVLLMVDDNGNVLGDLPLAQLEPSYKSDNPTQQVKDLLSLQNKAFNRYTENYENNGSPEAIVDDGLHIEGVDNLNLIFDVSKRPLVSKVKQVMRGVVPYRTSERNTLNAVADGQPFTLGVRVTGETIAIKEGDKEQHKEIVIPKVGSLGQPYLLLPTASGEQIAVPFYMQKFDVEKHKNTEFYMQLCNAVYQLIMSTAMQGAQKEECFHKHMNVLEGLLQVKGRKNGRIIEVSNGRVFLHLTHLTSSDTPIELSVPFTDAKESAKDLVEIMSGIPINVSLRFLNDTIETNIKPGEKRPTSYNQVIGEIADVNLPKGTTHTLNSWFTVELAPSTGIKPSKKLQPRITGKFSESFNGHNYEIDVDNMTIVDTSSGEFVSDDEDANLALAKAVAAAKPFVGKERIIIAINGEETRTYDIKEGRFVKVSEKKPEVKPQAAPKTENVTKEDVSITKETPANSGAENKPEEKKAGSRTIEQVEELMKNWGIVDRQTKDAWDVIPDALKLKLVNESADLILSYNGKTVTVSMYNTPLMKLELKKANMAARQGKLEVSVATKPMEKTGTAIIRENEQAARRWLAKNLPTLSSEERTQFVDKLAREGNNAGKYWGSYRSGVIQIQRNAPMGTVYHEAFHYVLDMVLSPEERKAVLDIATKEYGVNDYWTAEERLAEDFRRYAMDENATGIIGTIKRWLRKIKDKMTRYNRISDATVNQLFLKINNGELAKKATEVESFEESQQGVLREIRNVQKEKFSWSNLSAGTKSTLMDSGISEAVYNSMSLEEKQQYVKCRG